MKAKGQRSELSASKVQRNAHGARTHRTRWLLQGNVFETPNINPTTSPMYTSRTTCTIFTHSYHARYVYYIHDFKII